MLAETNFGSKLTEIEKIFQSRSANNAVQFFETSE